MKSENRLMEKLGWRVLKRVWLLGLLGVYPLGPQAAAAQSVSNGPPGGVVAIAIDPQAPATLYAGTFTGGVFKSSNGGASWTAINSSFVIAVAIDPQTPTTPYAGTAEGVLKSSNGGGSWTAINSGLPPNSDVLALAIDPQNPSRIYAGTAPGGVFVRTACNYSISPVSKSYSSSGIASDQLNVATTSSCPWNAVSNDSWITMTSGNSGSGNGVVTFSVLVNPGPGARIGTITIADQSFTVTEAGINPSFFVTSITPTTGLAWGGDSRHHRRRWFPGWGFSDRWRRPSHGQQCDQQPD